jgi:hypothetical protein
MNHSPQYQSQYYYANRGHILQLNRENKNRQAYSAQYRQDNLAVNRKKTNDYRFLNKEAAINMYSNGDAVCKWCGHGDLDVLCLDHVNNDGCKERTVRASRTGKLFMVSCGGDKLYNHLRKHDYPSGYQVLCANCNLKKEVLRRRAARI